MGAKPQCNNVVVVVGNFRWRMDDARLAAVTVSPSALQGSAKMRF